MASEEIYLELLDLVSAGGKNSSNDEFSFTGLIKLLNIFLIYFLITTSWQTF